MVFGLGLFFQWHILDIQKSLKENIISFHSAITQLKKKTLQYRWHLPQPPIPFPNYISPRSYCRPGFGVHGSTGVFVLLLFVWWRYKVHTVQYTNLNCTVWWPMGSIRGTTATFTSSQKFTENLGNCGILHHLEKGEWGNSVEVSASQNAYWILRFHYTSPF